MAVADRAMATRRTVIAAGAGLWLAPVSAARAHQLKEGFTRVLFNRRTGFIEVMHRFYAHDAEHAVRVLMDDPKAELHVSPEAQKRFGAYVASRFVIRDAEGEKIELGYIGQEIDGAFIWVYQEAPLRALTELTVENTVLHDLWEDQANLVNVEKNGEVVSAVFKSPTRPQKLSFKTASHP